jgi:hypothetical protein
MPLGRRRPSSAGARGSTTGGCRGVTMLSLQLPLLRELPVDAGQLRVASWGPRFEVMLDE